MSETVAIAPLTPSSEGNKKSVLPGRNIPSVTLLNKDATAETWTIRVFYQGPTGGIFLRKSVNGKWKEPSGPLWVALPGTPLAAVTWDTGLQTRVYYLDGDHKLQEYCQQKDGSWNIGRLGGMNVQAAPNTTITALLYQPNGSLQLRVYCQEVGSDNIQEFTYASTANRWARGEIVSSALSGTGLAARVTQS